MIDATHLVRIVLALIVCGSASTALSQPRYWARFDDGSIVTGDELKSWALQPNESVGAKGRLAGRDLFDKRNPVRALRDTTRQSKLTGAYIVLSNGDILPGSIDRFVPESLHLPAHFLLRIPVSNEIFGLREDPVEVIASEVLQIVATRRNLKDEMGLVTLVDGRIIESKSYRFMQTGVRFLTEQGVVNVSWGDIAAFRIRHREASDVCKSAAPPYGFDDALVARIRTTFGAELSYLPQMATRDIGETTRRVQRNVTLIPDGFAIQPSWALNAIVLRLSDLEFLHVRQLSEIDVALLPHVEAERRSKFSPRVNRNVRGSALQSGELAAANGIGIHAPSQLVIDLPRGAKTFSTFVGLDNSVGNGGCVRCRIHVNSLSSAPRWESGILRGVDAPKFTGEINIIDAKQLILVVDEAHADRPFGADPLDIRDQVNWLMPKIELQDESRQPNSDDLSPWIPALAGWSIDSTLRDSIELRPIWIKKENRWRYTTFSTAGQNQPLTFTRKAAITLNNAWLPVFVSRVTEHIDYTVSLQINGAEVGSTMNGNIRLKSRKGLTPDSRVWILSDYIDREIELRLVAKREGSKRVEHRGLVWWQGQIEPFVRNLPPDGKIIKPDVHLTGCSPIPDEQNPIETFAPGRLTDGRSLEIRDLPFDRGIGIPSESKISFNLRPEWRRFVAVIGLADGWKGVGPFEILVDNEILWQSKDPIYFARNESPEQIDVQLPPGGKTITLKVGGKSSRKECYAAFADAGFMTAP